MEPQASKYQQNMNVDEKLLRAAGKLVMALDKTADSCLPKEIADVVKLHSKLAVGSAWIPVPGADIAAGAANIWTMYARINKKAGIPFGENAMKSIASGVASNLVSYMAVGALASCIKLIPGLGTIGGGVLLSASLYAATLAAGWVYLQALSTLAEKKGRSFSAFDINNAVNEVLMQKSAIKDFISEAKKSYK